MTDVELNLKDYKTIINWYILAFARGQKKKLLDEKVYRKLITLKEAEDDFLESIKDE